MARSAQESWYGPLIRYAAEPVPDAKRPMNHNRILAASAALLLASAAPAQLAKGSVAPAFEIQKAWNDGPTKFDEFDGKLVILDFAQTW